MILGEFGENIDKQLKYKGCSRLKKPTMNCATTCFEIGISGALTGARSASHHTGWIFLFNEKNLRVGRISLSLVRRTLSMPTDRKLRVFL